MEGRPVRESISEYVELALPNDTNALGTLLGGKVMHIADVAGALAAMRHARCTVVTASIDNMTFLHPVRVGELVIARSSVNRVVRTSMEVGVKIWVEDLLTGEQLHTSSAYLTFVAIDAHGGRVPVAEVIPETEEEKRRYTEAGKRRTQRLALRNRSLQ